MFQSRKRFRHCWSQVQRAFDPAEYDSFNRESDSVTVGAPGYQDWRLVGTGFNRESDSVTVGARLILALWGRGDSFNRESDSVTVGAHADKQPGYAVNVSIAKAIPSLLEPTFSGRTITTLGVSIAKAIPSLLEHGSAKPMT